MTSMWLAYQVLFDKITDCLINISFILLVKTLQTVYQSVKLITFEIFYLNERWRVWLKADKFRPFASIYLIQFLK